MGNSFSFKTSWCCSCHFLHPRAKLIWIICTWLSRSQCSFAFGKCTKKRQPGQRKRTRHDRKMQSDRADEKKLFALLDRLTCPCRTPCSTNHGSSKSMIGFMIGIAISWLLRPVQINFARGGVIFWHLCWYMQTADFWLKEILFLSKLLGAVAVRRRRARKPRSERT